MKASNKIWKLVISMVILMALCNLPAVAGVKDKNMSNKVVSIQNIVINIDSGDKVSLPKTVLATLQDKRKTQVAVKWDHNTIESNKVGTVIIHGFVNGYSSIITLRVIIAPIISSIEDLSFNIKQYDMFILPAEVKATMNDGTSRYFNVEWNSKANSSEEGENIYFGTVLGYKYKVRATVNVYATINHIQDLDFTVNQYVEFVMPNVVLAEMSDSNTRMVKVSWNQKIDTSKYGTTFIYGKVEGYSTLVRMRVSVLPKILNIEDINIVIKTNEKLVLPINVSAFFSDNTEKSVAVKWEASDIKTASSGAYTLIGSVKGYDKPIQLKVDIIDEILNIEDISEVVNIGDSYKLPLEVKATALNGTIENVPVQWEKESVDTSSNEPKVYYGMVVGYGKPVKLTLQIKRTPIIMPDAKLKKCILTLLNKSDSELYVDEVAHITDLDISGKGIADLTGLENFTALKVLKLGYYFDGVDMISNRISNIDPLVRLNSLEELDLSGNRVTNITAIRNMPNLTKLYLNNNQITDISPLKNLKNLKECNVSENNISNVDVFGTITSLTSLLVQGLSIKDISWVSNLVDLTGFYATNNKIEDLAPLKDLKKLNILYMGTNNIKDLTTISGLTNLRELAVGWNNIVDISCLSNLEKLSFLSLEKNQITDISSLRNLTNLQYLYLKSNPIVDYSPVKEVYSGLKYKDFVIQ
jgi:internalin A